MSITLAEGVAYTDGGGGGGGGDVTGPASSTDNAIVRFDGTDGKLLQNSGVTVDDSANINGVNSLTVTTGGALRTGTSTGNTLLLQAYTVFSSTYTTFGTLTAGNIPSFALVNTSLNNTDGTQQAARFRMPQSSVSPSTVFGDGQWSKLLTYASAINSPTFSLPTGITAGTWFRLVNNSVAAGITVTFAPSGSDTITGNTTVGPGGTALVIRASTSNWAIFGGTATRTVALPLRVGTVADTTYAVLRMDKAGTITEISSISGSGTCTATTKINSTAVTATPNAVSTSNDTQAVSGANTFVAGDYINVEVTSNSACTDMLITIEYTYTENL